MFRHAIRIAALRGVDVRLDPSLLLLALLLGWLLFSRFSVTYSTGLAVTMAVLGSLLFFASILAHEVAHAFEAQHRGIEVDSITLLLFGGVTQMHTESRRPRDEFMVAAVGPYISLVCAAVFGLLAAIADGALPPVAAIPTVELARLLALVNLALAAFNLVPGAPLDGGRVLRAGLWWLLGDRAKAVQLAAWAGIGFALALVGVGVYTGSRAWPASATTALWWIAVGVFLFGAARVELRHGRLQGALRGLTVVDVLPPAAPRLHLDELVSRPDGDHLTPADRNVLPLVTDGDAEVVGWIEPRELAERTEGDGSPPTARQLLHPVGDAPGIDIEASLEDVVDRFVRGDHDRLRVEDEGRTIAVLTEAQVARMLERLRRGQEPVDDAVGAPA